MLKKKTYRVRLWKKLILIILFSFNTFGGSNEIYYYDQEAISLTGKIETQTFPGPPNYESIKNGDSIEKCWFLKLEKPIDVLSISKEEKNRDDPAFNVRIVQLAIQNDLLWDKIKKGKKVRVKGTLYHRQNGHHHSKVLIHTSGLEVLNE